MGKASVREIQETFPEPRPVRHQFEVFTSEGVAASGGELCERHLIGTTDLRVQVVHFPSKTVRRKPFGFCFRINKRPVHLFGRRTEHSVKPNRVPCHDSSPSMSN
jgi:hypothetical protein